MLKTGWSAAALVALVFVSLVAGCGSGSPSGLVVQAISFETQAVPGGGAGQLYNVVVLFGSEGGAMLPEQFSLSSGVLPPGVRLVPDREDANADGIPDEDGALTGHARIIGFPRETGSFAFTVKAISTGGSINPDQPDLSAAQPFTITVVEGSVAILTPPSEAGTTDPAVPAYDEVIPFVNPANPSAFYSFAFLIAGGTNNNINNIYIPRELELSSFDNALNNGDDNTTDTDESPTTNDIFESDFSDGGWFVLQAGNNKVQVGGFQSPRGPVGTIVGLNPEWFQRAPGAGPPQNSRRDFQDSTGLAGGDTTLGTAAAILFSDYFSPLYEDTHPESVSRRKYPFTADQYANAFFVPFVEGVDVTPLQYRIIVESIDTKGTRDKLDDQIARTTYIVRVQIPNINIDTVALPAAQAGVDYNEILAASGGVPPLSFELEYIDAVVGDGKATENGPGQLDKASFGLEMNGTTGQFFGFGRAQGDVDITVRVFAAVMNPTQSGNAEVPTGGAGEFDGAHAITGRKGRHKTITVSFAAPPPLFVANTTLSPGVDGFQYNGTPVSGVGGVPTYVPNPIDFVGFFPANAARTFTIAAEYVQDSSPGLVLGATAQGLPNALVIDGVATSPTNGVISGTAFDRGFHPVTIQLTDFFLGPATAPDIANATITTRVLGLSISPDSATYLRGGPTPGGQPTGLEDFQKQMLDADAGRNVPMVLAASMFKVDTGGQPTRVNGLPEQSDILPVLIANGGSDAHNNRSIPSIAGYWPAVSSFEDGWNYFQERDWQHLQQRMTWITVPNSHNRVFLWGETLVKQWNNGATTGGDDKRYQQYDPNGDRGIMITNPVSGDYWFVCRLSNSLAATNDHGSQFGAEVVMQRNNDGSGINGGYYFHDFTGYWKYLYQNATPSRHDRELLAVGLSSYIENVVSTSASNWYKTVQGRAGVSVAVSADGIWCATALPGGTNEQKILLWRTDKKPIPDAILGNIAHVKPLNGEDADGTVLPNMAAIFYLGGKVFAGDGGLPFVNALEMRRLNADSLMFVEGGLLFTQVGNMDRIFGISIVDGHLSTRRINVGQVNAGGTTTNLRFFSSFTLASRGQYVPDADYLRGQSAQQSFSVQFAFTGNEPEDGEAGPNRVAFVAGETATLNYFANDGAAPIDGKHQRGNRNMSLMFLEIVADGTGLRLDASTMKDLTGSDPDVYGDLLTPGRPGEEQDYVAVSPDGNFAAVVRDRLPNDERTSSFSFYVPTFASNQTSSTSWNSTDDLLLISTQGIDMDTTAGTQHVLFLGTRAISTNGGDASGMPSYASSRNVINGRWKRVNGLQFSTDSKTLFFNYSSDSSYSTKFTGQTTGRGINPDLGGTSTTFSFGTQQLVQIDFRNGNSAIAFKSGSQSSFASNPLAGFSTGGTIGDTSPPFGDTHATSTQQFWATFRSANNSFLYYISDQYRTVRVYMVGFNMTDGDINGHEPFEPFSPHGSTIGFAQFECNSFNYENRFASVAGGVVYPPSGRDGDGILLVIASDSSAGATSATDLEVYAFDANNGGDMFALTSDVTNGASNAINDMYLSADGNFLIFFRAETSARNRSGARATLTGNTDMGCVNNIHAVLFSGAAPNAFFISENMSHGSSVAFVGEGTATGPQAVIYSSAASGSNASVDDRTLKISLLAPGQTPGTLDATRSHYEVLIGSRTLNDDPNTGN